MNLDYAESGDGFMVTLTYDLQKSAKRITSTPEKNISGGVNGGVNTLFELIQLNPGLSAKIISEQLATPQRTIERWLKQLKQQHKIKFVGATKTGGYQVI